MKLTDLNTVRNLLSEFETAPEKRFGQNFLINQKAREKLIEVLDVQKDTTVWEIGPGLGAMTSGLLSKGADVTVFEIDRGFVSLLGQFFDYRSLCVEEFLRGEFASGLMIFVIGHIVAVELCEVVTPGGDARFGLVHHLGSDIELAGHFLQDLLIKKLYIESSCYLGSYFVSTRTELSVDGDDELLLSVHGIALVRLRCEDSDFFCKCKTKCSKKCGFE